MKRSTYLNQSEFDELLVLQAYANHCGSVAEKCTDPIWRKWLKTADTFVTKVIENRVVELDKRARESLKRRVYHSDVLVVQSNLVHIKENSKQTITLDVKDLETVLDLAANQCCKCPKQMKTCTFADMMLRIGVAVVNDDPKNGECPYKSMDPKWIKFLGMQKIEGVK